MFNGINFSDLPQIEDLFKINIVIYQLDENVAKLIQKSRELFDETMRLNLYHNHPSLITGLEKYCIVHQCSKIKSNLHYTRRITPKRVTSCGAHLRGLAPGQHSSEETSQRWRVVGDTVPV